MVNGLDGTRCERTEPLGVSLIRSGKTGSGQDRELELSSDLSHSPAATESSVHSGSQEESAHLERERPHLADSGIVFEERSWDQRLIHWTRDAAAVANGQATTTTTSTEVCAPPAPPPPSLHAARPRPRGASPTSTLITEPDLEP